MVTKKAPVHSEVETLAVPLLPEDVTPPSPRIADVVIPQTQRDIRVIEEELAICKQRNDQSIFEYGKLFVESKALLEHGEWLKWLRKHVPFSLSKVQKLMQIANEYDTAPVFADLGISKLLFLIAIPKDKRNEFIRTFHIVNGKKKSVKAMSKRELQDVIKKHNGEQIKTIRKSSEKATPAKERAKPSLRNNIRTN
jgi:hypothetical protein